MSRLKSIGSSANDKLAVHKIKQDIAAVKNDRMRLEKTVKVGHIVLICWEAESLFGWIRETNPDCSERLNTITEQSGQFLSNFDPEISWIGRGQNFARKRRHSC